MFNPPQKPWPYQKINAGHPLAHGLVSCLAINEGAGNTIIDLVPKLLLTKTGTSNWVITEGGLAIDQAAGANYYSRNVDSGLVNLTTSFTIEAIFIPDIDLPAGEYQCLIQAGSATNNRIGLWLYNQSIILVSGSGFYTAVPNSTNAGVLSHIVYTHSDTEDLAYFNGVYVGGDNLVNPVSLGGTLHIGYSIIQSGYGADGKHILYRIWNRTLNPAEVLQLYRKPYAMFEPVFNEVLFGYVAAGGGWTGKICGVDSTDIAKIMGVAIADIAKVCGV